MPVTGPRAHPDHDLLADLAAEVLPDDLAGRVRSHVDRCADCADLLNQAEGMRSMLRADDPGPMPVDVAARLDDVLAQLRAGTLDVTATEPDDPEVEARWNAVAREPIAAWDSQPVRHRPAQDAGERVTRLHRATDGPVRERRTSLDEQRSDERVGRWRRRVFAAAAAVVVVGAGGALVRAVETGSFGEAPTSAGSSADAGSDAGSGEGGPARPESASEPNTASGRSSKAAAPVLQTGTNYTDTAFATQARAVDRDRADTILAGAAGRREHVRRQRDRIDGHRRQPDAAGPGRAAGLPDRARRDVGATGRGGPGQIPGTGVRRPGRA